LREGPGGEYERPADVPFLPVFSGTGKMGDRRAINSLTGTVLLGILNNR